MSTGAHAVTLIPGDGIGPEVTGAALRVVEAAGVAIDWDEVEAAGVAIDWDEVEAGAEVVQKYGTPVPPAVLDSIRRTGVALKGPIVGKRIANPTAVILSAVEMLRHLDERKAADRIERAVLATLAEPQLRTRDLGGPLNLDAYTDAVVERLD